MALAEAPYHGRFLFSSFFWGGVSIASSLTTQNFEPFTGPTWKIRHRAAHLLNRPVAFKICVTSETQSRQDSATNTRDYCNAAQLHPMTLNWRTEMMCKAS